MVMFKDTAEKAAPAGIRPGEEHPTAQAGGHCLWHSSAPALPIHTACCQQQHLAAQNHPCSLS